MAVIGQAQAAACLTREIVRSAEPPAGGRIVIASAGTGQVLNFLDLALFRQFRLTCIDLNPSFLARLEERLAKDGLSATVLEDDIEHTALEGGADLLIATLLLEHIDWRRGIEVFAGLRPVTCGIIIQENPLGMTSAVTPGRRVPPSIAEASKIAQPTLVPQNELLAAFKRRSYKCTVSCAQDVADRKRLIAMLFFCT